jgi:hypothetical protein
MIYLVSSINYNIDKVIYADSGIIDLRDINEPVEEFALTKTNIRDEGILKSLQK